jgi:putative spermidine/putrescine transport system substrate-binding protein
MRSHNATGWDGKFSRRRFLAASSSAVTGALATPYIRRASAAQQVIVASGSGTYKTAQIDAYFKPFTAGTGIEVVAKDVLSLAQKKAMMETGDAEVDIFGHALSDVAIMAKSGWLAPVDYGSFRPQDIAAIAPTDRHQYGLGFIYWAEVMAYRTDVFGPGHQPKTWVDFWDVTRFPGNRCFGDPSYNYAIEFAAIADGVPMDNVYPFDMARALKSLSRIRNSIISYYGKSGALPAQQLHDKEVVLASTANGRVQEIIDAGLPVVIEWNQGMMYHTFYSVAKNAPNKQNAMKLLAYIAQPEPQAKFASIIPYGPSNAKAYDLIPEKLGRTLPTYPAYREKMFVKDEEWWISEGSGGKSNREVMIELWDAWKLQ